MLEATSLLENICVNDASNERLFASIAQDIEQKGFSIRPKALSEDLQIALSAQQQKINDNNYSTAGIGRAINYLKNDGVRSDKISWITGQSVAENNWLYWVNQLRTYLNRHLFLGLFSFESHFAHYQPGDFYRRHYDAFKGESNRILSLIIYLNEGWTQADEGKLVLYGNDHDREGIKVIPAMGTLVTFLSEDFPHEVLPANRDRFSIAGWFRINTSTKEKTDPPL
ncbi:2OG-Fe(II) oxygenase [Endozoicomonas sp. Mp262]|uniref:2OG-Fe(II) oxygenase n=1 Tax=Endozoicomonas sp. Mp262 TaxID=2919499 RepID=UPI0021DA319B